METKQYNTLPYEDYSEGLIYDGNEFEVNRIEEYGNDEYNFYPDAAF